MDQLVEEWQTECALAIAIAQIQDAIDNHCALVLIDSRTDIQEIAYSPDENSKVQGCRVVIWDPSVEPRSSLVQNMILDIEEYATGVYLNYHWSACFIRN
ncbi:MAG: hypothetical protein D6741_13300 [Planctomycetota bacterium]|nr:MAG: hypothetical protein D6741_13300 [Planctomycetota bacterium]